ncbi:MAG: TIM-barrel domain-containing protein [Anaerolineaceae bacterium]
MNKQIDWNSIAAPLDVRNVYSPRYFIRKWLTYQSSPQGIIFSCELANGYLIDYYVDVIQADVIRFRMNAFGLKESPSDILLQTTFPPYKFVLLESEELVTLVTDRLRVEFPRTWQITVFDDPRPGFGNVFFSERTDDRAYGPGFEVAPSGYDLGENNKHYIRESVSVRPGESFYGLGEKFTSLDKWNQEIPLWAVDSGNVSSYRSYKNVPFLLSSTGYGLFIHSSYPMLFRMGSESTITYSVHIEDSQLDMFLIYGPSFKHILKRYSELTGFAPIPPKWSFGFWISRAGFRSRMEVESVIQEMRKRGFPCDVLSLDPWWMGEGPWCSYEWDEEQFPNPAEMIQWMKSQGIRICLWIHPYVPKGSPLYLEGKGLGFFIKKESGDISSVVEAFSGNDLGAVDFTNPKAIAWWQSKLEILHDMGVSVFKTDFGEQAPIEALYHDGRSGLEMHNIYPLLYNRTAFELSKKKFGRGLVWGRSAYAGSQRYPVQWGGDSYSTLDQLSCQVRALIGYGLSGIPFCSHDVGGFDYSPHFFDDTYNVDFKESYNDSIKDTYPKDAEVYIRWLQVGVFSSHIRAHGKQAREPWTYGEEVESISKKFLRLRYRLLPYIYSQAVISSRTGLPMVRPMLLEFQEDRNTQRLDLQYMFGESFLVAPVFTHEHIVDVYLPNGTWIDYWTKEMIEGGIWLKVDAPLETLPLWVREGSIIPYGPDIDFVEQEVSNKRTIEIFAPIRSAETIIEDEDRQSIHVSYQKTKSNLFVNFEQHSGETQLRVFGLKINSAILDGNSLALNSIQNGCELSFEKNGSVKIICEIGEGQDD